MCDHLKIIFTDYSNASATDREIGAEVGSESQCCVADQEADCIADDERGTTARVRRLQARLKPVMNTQEHCQRAKKSINESQSGRFGPAPILSKTSIKRRALTTL